MKSYAICSLISALAGALVAISWNNAWPLARVDAQEVQRIPQVGAAPLPAGFGAGLSPPGVDHFTPEERVNIGVYEAVNRSVANINTKGVQREAFFFLDVDVPTEGMGSGSVLDRAGHILTNYHVIEGARQIEVSLFNGRTFPAQPVGHDASSDLAVIRVEAPPEMLFPVMLGDAAQLKVGQRVFAIGNPFGLERTLTTGIISSLNRSVPNRSKARLHSMIQIDAAINPGNSGGPLLDSSGRLIGMNTAIASRTGQSTGVGFAIPVSTIARFLPQLIEKGRVVRPDLGITRVYETEQGLLIAAMAPGGPAEQAGLRGPQVRRDRKKQGPFVYESQQIDRTAADLIVAVDGTRITTAEQFLNAIETRLPGDQVAITVMRQGQEVTVRARLVESP